MESSVWTVQKNIKQSDGAVLMCHWGDSQCYATQFFLISSSIKTTLTVQVLANQMQITFPAEIEAILSIQLLHVDKADP